MGGLSSCMALVVFLAMPITARARLHLLGDGQCMTSSGGFAQWIKSYATRPHGKKVSSIDECYRDCRDAEKCTAVGYSPAFNACVLYTGGPYTKSEYWSMYT